MHAREWISLATLTWILREIVENDAAHPRFTEQLDWWVADRVADPCNSDTDPDPGSEKIRYGSGSRPSFDTDPDPGKNDTDPDPVKKRFNTRKILKI